MNLKLISIFLLAFANIISVPLIAYAVSQYDKDGYTIFPTKSWDYMNGYRDGAVKASQDIQKFDAGTIQGIEGNQAHVACPHTDMGTKPDYCNGFKDGYSDEVIDRLD